MNNHTYDLKLNYPYFEQKTRKTNKIVDRLLELDKEGLVSRESIHAKSDSKMGKVHIYIAIDSTLAHFRMDGGFFSITDKKLLMVLDKVKELKE